MKINMARLAGRMPSGEFINYAVFDVRPTRGDHNAMLARLTAAARESGFEVHQSALAFKVGGGTEFYGDKDLVLHLSECWVPRWTHTIDV